MMRRILLALVLAAAVAAACPSEKVFGDRLKKGLFDYLQNPAEAKLTLYEIQDLLGLYLSGGVETADCTSVTGPTSGMIYSAILRKTQDIRDSVVPRCSDGTMYGECSANRPKFCYSGILKPMCYGPDMKAGTGDDCGCPDYQTCRSDGTCDVLSIACYSDDECGESTAVGSKFCSGDDVVQNYTHFTCSNPGTAESECSYTIEQQTVTSCSGACMGGECMSS